MKRILICGDRNWNKYGLIDTFVGGLPKDTVIIQGMCRGADTIARSAALRYGLAVEDYPAYWDLYGRAAGPIRNAVMIKKGKPDIVVAFHDNIEKSKGTKNMLEQAKKANIKCVLITCVEDLNAVRTIIELNESVRN